MHRFILGVFLSFGFWVPSGSDASTLGGASYVGQLFMQEVQFCDNVGSRGCFGPSYDAHYLQSIFDPIGLLITALPTLATFNTDLTPDTNGEVDAGTLLNDFRGAFPAPFPTFTVFAGFVPDLIGSVVGLGYVNAPGAPFTITQMENLGGTTPAVDGRIQATILAHEIGHNLGGLHENAAVGELMSASYSPTAFEDAAYIPLISIVNREAFLSSALVGPAPSVVPLPAGLPLLAMAAAMLAALRTRERPRAMPQSA